MPGPQVSEQGATTFHSARGPSTGYICVGAASVMLSRVGSSLRVFRGRFNTALGSPVLPATCRPIIASRRNASRLYYLICLASRPFQPPWPGLSGAQLIAFTPSQRLYVKG